MKVKSYLSMLGIAAMLASCSNEDVLQGTNDSGNNTVTITATLDEGMLTRATGDDNNESITRAIVRVYEDADATVQVGEQVTGTPVTGGFTFTIPDLVSGKEYTFLFWADDNSSYDITDLTAVSISSDPTLAYSLATAQTPEQISQDGVELKHAVSKISLRTTNAVDAGKNITLSVPTYTTFNILENKATGDLRTNNVTSTQNEAVEANATVASVYVLGTDEAQPEKVTVQYDSRPTMLEYTNLPINPNKHIVIQGNVNEIGITDANFTATLDESWDEDTEIFPDATVSGSTIKTYGAGQIAKNTALISQAIGTGNDLKIEGPMNADDFAALKAYLTEHTSANLCLDLTGMTEMTEIPEYAFEVCNGLYEVKLSDEITRIGTNAFCQCENLTKINIPQKLESMGVAAFRYIALNEPIELPEGFTTLDTNGEGRKGCQFSSSKITAVTLPASIGEITKEKAISFEIMRELTTVTFKSVVKELHEYAFYWCDNLTDIYMLGNTDSAPEFPTEETAFTEVEPTNVTIHVPQGASKYFSEWIAQDFKVVEMTE